MIDYSTPELSHIEGSKQSPDNHQNSRASIHKKSITIGEWSPKMLGVPPNQEDQANDMKSQHSHL